jgi:hypothetical protein
MRALERKAITFRVNLAEYLELETRARHAGLTVPNYIRTQLGFQVRWSSNLGSEERDREEDDAWERLRRLGLDPMAYFPRDE